jgi:hypothetical protein
MNEREAEYAEKMKARVALEAIRGLQALSSLSATYGAA